MIYNKAELIDIVENGTNLPVSFIKNDMNNKEHIHISFVNTENKYADNKIHNSSFIVNLTHFTKKFNYIFEHLTFFQSEFNAKMLTNFENDGWFTVVYEATIEFDHGN
jgi:hypothetical protein